MRAGANPLISVAGLSIGGLLSTSLVAEAVTGWPGLGSLMLESVFSRDVFVVMASVLLTAVLFAAGTLVADVALYASDPRIRRSQ
jgi:peptide/nickel transport system permease protein